MFKTFDNSQLSNVSGGVGSKYFTAPQYSNSSRENFTMYSRPTAFGPSLIEAETVGYTGGSVVFGGMLDETNLLKEKTYPFYSRLIITGKHGLILNSHQAAELTQQKIFRDLLLWYIIDMLIQIQTQVRIFLMFHLVAQSKN